MLSVILKKIDELFDRLSVVEGLSGNLRGAMFEMIVGHLVKDLYAGSIDIGEIVTDYATKSIADIDVRNVGADQIICFECKGYDSEKEVTLEEVKYWLEKQVPIFRGAHNLESRLHGLKERFEFWTTGIFSVEALAYLNERKAAIKKYEIDWKVGT